MVPRKSKLPPQTWSRRSDAEIYATRLMSAWSSSGYEFEAVAVSGVWRARYCVVARLARNAKTIGRVRKSARLSIVIGKEF